MIVLNIIIIILYIMDFLNFILFELLVIVLFCPLSQVHHYIKYPDDLQWNHVSACILNGGGIRSPIDERSRNGVCLCLCLVVHTSPLYGAF